MSMTTGGKRKHKAKGNASGGRDGGLQPSASRLFHPAVTASRLAAGNVQMPFSLFLQASLGEGAAQLIAIAHLSSDTDASTLIMHDVSKICLEVIFADIGKLLNEGLEKFSVPLGSADTGAGASPAKVPFGFLTTETDLPDLPSLIEKMHEACSPGGESGIPYPHKKEQLLADVLQRISDRGEVFTDIDEACVYLALIYQKIEGKRVVVGAYIGSAMRRFLHFLDAYDARARSRVSSILTNAGIGDSNLAIVLASMLNDVEQGRLVKEDVDIEVFKTGVRVPADGLPPGLGGAHCLGLWAELHGITHLWKYKVRLNRDANPLTLNGSGGFDSTTGAAAGE